MDVFPGLADDAHDEYDLPHDILNDTVFQDSKEYGLSDSIDQDTAMPDLPSDQQEFSSDSLPSSIYDHYPGNVPYGIFEQIPSSPTPPTSPDVASKMPIPSHVAENEKTAQRASSLFVPPSHSRLEIVDGVARVKVGHHYAAGPNYTSSSPPTPVGSQRDSIILPISYDTDRGRPAWSDGSEHHDEGEASTPEKGSGQQDFGAKFTDFDGRAEQLIASLRRQRRQQASLEGLAVFSERNILLQVEVPYCRDIKIEQHPDGYVRIYMHPPRTDKYIEDQGYPGLPQEQAIYKIGSGLHENLPCNFFVLKDGESLLKENISGKGAGEFYIMNIKSGREDQDLDFVIRIDMEEDIGPIKRLFTKPGQDGYFPSTRPTDQEAPDMHNASDAEMSLSEGEELSHVGSMDEDLKQAHVSKSQREINEFDEDEEGDKDIFDVEEENDNDEYFQPAPSRRRGTKKSATVLANGNTNITNSAINAMPAPPSAPATQAQLPPGMVHLNCPYPNCDQPQVTRSKNRRTDIVTHMINVHGLEIPANLRARGGHISLRNQRVAQQNDIIRAFFTDRNLVPTNNDLY
ncbi:hypothetical protein Tdes44962_MAKER07972 [Teratosphaeria destructans]|uniref:Uncharacterized protein n=1 Tax=Teratosphaeria destructans TaxID=418781 RepID=A0A9W7SXS7_9PEZI|nr:hypothetical protein Tdes44962_MAKER07972 [Teratosphaeria destructans]